jgi:hypothetical protein
VVSRAIYRQLSSHIFRFPCLPKASVGYPAPHLTAFTSTVSFSTASYTSLTASHEFPIYTTSIKDKGAVRAPPPFPIRFRTSANTAGKQKRPTVPVRFVHSSSAIHFFASSESTPLRTCETAQCGVLILGSMTPCVHTTGQPRPRFMEARRLELGRKEQEDGESCFDG